MKLSLKICGLCGKVMTVCYPTVPNDVVRYLCSEHYASSKLSHYYIEVNGSFYNQVIHVPPYTVVNRSTNEESEIYSLGRIQMGAKIMSIPRIPVTTPEKMATRIKVLIPFS